MRPFTCKKRAFFAHFCHRIPVTVIFERDFLKFFVGHIQSLFNSSTVLDILPRALAVGVCQHNYYIVRWKTFFRIFTCFFSYCHNLFFHCFLELFNTFFSQLIPFLVVNCILTPYVFTGFFKHPFSSCFEIIAYSGHPYLGDYIWRRLYIISCVVSCFFLNIHNYFSLSALINASAYLTAAAESFFGIPRPVPLSEFEHHALTYSHG